MFVGFMAIWHMTTLSDFAVSKWRQWPHFSKYVKDRASEVQEIALEKEVGKFGLEG